MKLTRIFTGTDNCSHFEELELPTHEERRVTSVPVAAARVAFGESGVLAPQDWHHAPRRQIVAVLSGAMEIEVGDGSKRRFGAGDVFMADDLTGQGHLTRDLEGPLRTLYVYLPVDLDISAWRK